MYKKIKNQAKCTQKNLQKVSSRSSVIIINKLSQQLTLTIKGINTKNFVYALMMKGHKLHFFSLFKPKRGFFDWETKKIAELKLKISQFEDICLFLNRWSVA